MKRNPPVVITRRDKRLFVPGHFLGFALTGGASVWYTALKASLNGRYNARTRRLQDRANYTPPLDAKARFRAEHVPASREYKELHSTRS